MADGSSNLSEPQMMKMANSSAFLQSTSKSFSSRYRSFAELMQELAYLDIQMDKAQSSIFLFNVLKEVACTKKLATAGETMSDQHHLLNY